MQRMYLRSFSLFIVGYVSCSRILLAMLKLIVVVAMVARRGAKKIGDERNRPA